MPVKLTETAIKAATKRVMQSGQRLDVSDAGESGLRLRLTPTSVADSISGTWVLACRDPMGGMRRFQLGRYPALGLAEARAAARSMRETIRKGDDPIAEAKRKRAIGRDAREGVGTLAALIDLYAKKEGHKRNTWNACRKMIEHVFAAHLAKPLATMKLGDLQMTADSHKAQQSAAAAVRYLRPILKWASHTGRGYAAIEMTLIKPPATVKRRERVLSEEELAKLLPVLKASVRPYAFAMRFILLTLARRKEVAEATWGAVDFKGQTWTIPAELSKNGKPHVVPLSRQAFDLLRSLLPKDQAGNEIKPTPSVRLFATTSGEPLVNWDRDTKAIMQASGTKGWTRHDLRRTGATMLGEMGEMPNIIEAALNHINIGGQLAATYNRSRYRPQVAAALQRLADALDGIESGSGNVVPLSKVGA